MQKQKFQKVLAAVMSVAVLGTCAAVTSFATSEDNSDDGNRHVIDLDIDDINTSLDSSKPTFALSSATAKAGEEVTVELTCSNNPGIAAWKVKLAYDSSALELVSVDSNGVFGSAFNDSSDLNANPFTTGWFGTSDVEADGTMSSYTFKVKDDAADGDYTLSLTYNDVDVANLSEELVAFQTVNGTITVKSEDEPTTTVEPPTTTVAPPTTTVEPPTTTVAPPTTTVEPPTTSQPTTTKTTDPSTTGKASTRGETSSSPSSGTTGTSTTTNTSAVQTGAATPAVVILLMLAAAVVGMVVYRKKIK